VKEYTQKLRADGGTCVGAVHFSLDEKVGDCKILARDVASGVVGVAGFHVEAGGGAERRWKERKIMSDA